MISNLSNIAHERNQEKNVTIQYYDLSNPSIRKFVNELTPQINNLDTKTTKFDDFLSIFTTTCKLETPKISRRNNITNPWITEGIILSVKNKQKLYKVWKKSKNKNQPDGDKILYNKFSDYRKYLKNVIKEAKSTFYCKKIIESDGDRKKMWKTINEIRGKRKSDLKFFINNLSISEDNAL